MDEIKIGPVPNMWKHCITNLIKDYNHVFAKNDLDLGCTDAVKHQIHLTDNTSYKEKSRPVAPADFDLNELLDSGVIRESQSPIVRRKSGKVRMTVDF